LIPNAIVGRWRYQYYCLSFCIAVADRERDHANAASAWLIVKIVDVGLIDVGHASLGQFGGRESDKSLITRLISVALTAINPTAFGGLQQFGRPMQVPLALSLPAYLDALQNLALQCGS
jgi:hypothetical protein